MRDMTDLDKYRDILSEQKLFGGSDAEQRRLGGLFFIPTKGTRRGLKVIASSGELPEAQGWDHVSVSLPNRCPSWEEMDKVKRLFFLPHEICFQLHPAESNHISNHSYCLHIWRNMYQDIPLPPPGMVGNSEIGAIKEGTISIETIRREQEKALVELRK